MRLAAEGRKAVFLAEQKEGNEVGAGGDKRGKIRTGRH